MAAVSQFAAPRDGEASLWSACGSSPLGLPGARESGDSFAVRSPPGTARPHCDLRRTPLRWTSQVPTKLATVSQDVTPQGRRGLTLICV